MGAVLSAAKHCRRERGRDTLQHGHDVEAEDPRLRGDFEKGLRLKRDLTQRSAKTDAPDFERCLFGGPRDRHSSGGELSRHQRPPVELSDGKRFAGERGFDVEMFRLEVDANRAAMPCRRHRGERVARRM